VRYVYQLPPEGNESEKMADLHSNIARARTISKRLVRRNRDVASAEAKRDNCLYKFLTNLHQIDNQLRAMTVKEARKELNVKYNVRLSAKPDSGLFAIKVAHPDLAPKTRSKYAAVLRLIRKKKKYGESIRKFVRANDDINGCVEKEKQLRDSGQLNLGKRRKSNRASRLERDLPSK
jgi:hypothetical protein